MNDGPWRASVYGKMFVVDARERLIESCSVSFMFMQARLLKLNLVLAFQLTYLLLESNLGIEAVSAILTSLRCQATIFKALLCSFRWSHMMSTRSWRWQLRSTWMRSINAI